MLKIIVPIKQVPETGNVKMDPETGTMVRDGVVSIVNPLDLYSIETALMLKEKYGATVTVLTMGPLNAVKALKEAIAMGCDEGYILSDRAFAGADTWSTAYALVNAIKRIGDYDLILAVNGLPMAIPVRWVQTSLPDWIFPWLPMCAK